MRVVNCPVCGLEHKISDEGLGKTYRCSQCNGTFLARTPLSAASPKKQTGIASLKKQSAGPSLKQQPDASTAPRKQGTLIRAAGIAVSLLAYTAAAVGATVVVFKQDQLARERRLEEKETELRRKEDELAATAKAMEKYQVLLDDVKSREEKLRAEQEKWTKGEHEKMREWRQRQQDEMQQQQRRQQNEKKNFETEKAAHNDEIKLLKTQLGELQAARKKEQEDRLAELAAHQRKIDELKRQRESLLSEQKQEDARKKTEEELFAEERAKKREDRAFHRELKKDEGGSLDPAANLFYRQLVGRQSSFDG